MSGSVGAITPASEAWEKLEWLPCSMAVMSSSTFPIPASISFQPKNSDTVLLSRGHWSLSLLHLSNFRDMILERPRTT